MEYKSRVVMKLFFAVLFLFSVTGCLNKKNADDYRRKLKDYDVIWNSTSENSLGSMPLGNGDIGLNVWVEKSGDICFYISKTDAWDDNSRLVKIGKVRVTLKPENGRLPSFNFQTLKLETGSVDIQYGEKSNAVNVSVWVDANHPVINVDVNSDTPVELIVKNEMWRTGKDTLESISHGDVMFNPKYSNGSEEPVIIEPDFTLKQQTNQIGWYHHNVKSIGPEVTAVHQGINDLIKDPVINRVFGAVVTADSARVLDDKTLLLGKNREQHLEVIVRTDQPSSPDEWLKNVVNDITSTHAIERSIRRKAHEEWWQNFWSRSWIFITENEKSDTHKQSDAFTVSRAYTLQRFVTACSGRGKYPIKFNGSIFTAKHPGKPGGPDYRRWGPAYWWQNTRLPYISMCASGDFEMMKPLFKLYVDDLFDFFKKRTKRYLGHGGLYITEEMYIWGAIPQSTYGWDSTFVERTDKLQEAGYHKYEWVSSLELLQMMLDYYDYTEDTLFLKQKILPFAHEALKFFDEQYETDKNGKLFMYPSQALETWWDCTNPMPEIAGLYADTERLLNLSTSLTSKDDRVFWTELRQKLPDIPLREIDGVKLLAPAERYENHRNIERPEMYAVFPFNLYGIHKPNIDYAKRAMENHWKVAHNGWSQDDIFYAYMGETARAKKAIVERAEAKAKSARFPAFWQANFDWTPDQDHGSVLVKAIQSIILQTDGDKIYLMPAWPKDWNVSFKLHAPGKTVIEGVYRNGTFESIKVTPSSRKQDVVFVVHY